VYRVGSAAERGGKHARPTPRTCVSVDINFPRGSVVIVCSSSSVGGGGGGGGGSSATRKVATTWTQ